MKHYLIYITLEEILIMGLEEVLVDELVEELLVG